MIDKSEIVKRVSIATGGKYDQQGDEILTSCFACGEPRFKFSFNIEKMEGHCWVCGATAIGLPYYFSRLGISKELASISTEANAWADLKKKVAISFTQEYSVDDNISLIPVELPDDAYKVFAYLGIKETAQDVINYLSSRGFTSYKIIGLINPYYSYTFPNWFILPIYEKGQMVYWIRRTLQNTEPKYMAPQASSSEIMFSRRDVLWGIDEVKDGGEVVICEGIFSAASVIQANNIPAVALLGKHFTPRHKKLLLEKNLKKIYIAFDGVAYRDDSLKKAQEVHDYFVDHVDSVEVLRLAQGKDPNDLKGRIF